MKKFLVLGLLLAMGCAVHAASQAPVQIAPISKEDTLRSNSILKIKNFQERFVVPTLQMNADKAYSEAGITAATNVRLKEVQFLDSFHIAAAHFVITITITGAGKAGKDVVNVMHMMFILGRTQTDQDWVPMFNFSREDEAIPSGE